MLRTSVGLVAGQAVARRLDRHGDRILVPVGHRALALGEATQAGGEPLVGVVDGLTLQAQARHIGPIGHDSDHCAFPPLYERAFIGWLLARRTGAGEMDLIMADKTVELGFGVQNYVRQPSSRPRPPPSSRPEPPKGGVVEGPGHFVAAHEKVPPLRVARSGRDDGERGGDRGKGPSTAPRCARLRSGSG